MRLTARLASKYTIVISDIPSLNTWNITNAAFRVLVVLPKTREPGPVNLNVFLALWVVKFIMTSWQCRYRVLPN